MIRSRHWLLPGLIGGLLVVVPGCARTPQPVLLSERWVVGAEPPRFDPGGPPHALRHALERLLARGLTDFDSAGRVVPGLASRWEWSADSTRLVFHLRPGLRFADGSVVASADIEQAVRAGLARRDHATHAWLLRAVRGVREVRSGRPLPPLGISSADPGRVEFELEWPDPRLPEALALPGVSTPWRGRGEGWNDAVGCGPWRLATHGAREWRLVPADSTVAVAVADTLVVRFAPGPARVRALLRAGGVDRVWPVPPGLVSAPLPAGHALARREAFPPRHLLLVPRSDRPPFTQATARRALARATPVDEVLAALGPRGAPARDFPAGAGPPTPERLDPRAVRDESERATGRGSFSFELGFDAEGEGAEVARTLQGAWAASGLYAELRPARGAGLAVEAHAPGGAQVRLVEDQPLLPGPAAAAAGWVLPIRGPAVGAYRVGWRTRDLDPALLGRGGLSALALREVVEGERILMPLAALGWTCVVRQGGVARLHPRFGPEHAYPAN